MYDGSNCDRKSQLSDILTGPLNPRDSIYMVGNLQSNSTTIICLRKKYFLNLEF